MAGGRIYGSFGQVKIEKAGAATGAIAVASLNKWNANFATDKADVTSFGDTTKQFVTGLPSATGAVSGFWDNVDRTLFEVALGSKKIFLELVPDSREPTFLFHGLAYLDAAIDVPATGPVTVSGNWAAAGNWSAAPAFT